MERIFEREERVTTRKPPQETRLDKIPVKKEEAVSFVPMDDIFFIEAAGKYSYIYKRDEKLLCDLSLKEIEDSVAGSSDLYRVHRSYIVNLNRVNRVVKEAPEKYIVELTDDAGTMIYVSRRRLKGLRDILRF